MFCCLIGSDYASDLFNDYCNVMYDTSSESCNEGCCVFDTVCTVIMCVHIIILCVHVYLNFVHKQHSGNQESPQGNLTHIHNAHITFSLVIHMHTYYMHAVLGGQVLSVTVVIIQF